MSQGYESGLPVLATSLHDLCQALFFPAGVAPLFLVSQQFLPFEEQQLVKAAASLQPGKFCHEAFPLVFPLSQFPGCPAEFSGDGGQAGDNFGNAGLDGSGVHFLQLAGESLDDPGKAADGEFLVQDFSLQTVHFPCHILMLFPMLPEKLCGMGMAGFQQGEAMLLLPVFGKGLEGAFIGGRGKSKSGLSPESQDFLPPGQKFKSQLPFGFFLFLQAQLLPLDFLLLASGFVKGSLRLCRGGEAIFGLPKFLVLV